MANRTLTMRLSFDQDAIEQLEQLYERHIPDNISIHVDDSDTGLESHVGMAIGLFFAMYVRKSFGTEAAQKMLEVANRNYGGSINDSE